MRKWFWRALVGLVTLATLIGGGAAAARKTFHGLPVVTVLLNGQPLAADVPPVVVADRTLVPLRALAEATGYEVTWDPAAQTVHLQSAEAAQLAELRARVAELEALLAIRTPPGPEADGSPSAGLPGEAGQGRLVSHQVLPVVGAPPEVQAWAWGVPGDREQAVIRRAGATWLLWRVEKPNPGYQVEVMGVTEEAGTIVVRARLVPPPPGTFWTQVLVRATLLVKLPDSPLPVRGQLTGAAPGISSEGRI